MEYEGLHKRYARLLSEYESLLGGAGGGAALKKEEDETRARLTKMFEGMMEALYEQQGATFNIGILAESKAQEFIGAHSEVLDSSFKTVKMSDAMRRRLTRSDYIFSGIKAFHEMNEAFPSLVDENGERKPFERFLNDVRKIDETYNSNYLRAEYNFVQQSATMAAKWEAFMEDGDRYNLQYRTAGDDHVRPAHAALEGVTLPPSDAFWAEYYPPNGWNCFVAGTPVLSAHGWMPIEEIKAGDLVYGGSGYLRKVTATLERDVEAELVSIVTKGATTTCTKNHRFLTRRGWVAASDLHAGDILIQVGENAPLHKLVNAIGNVSAIGRKAFMSLVAKREAVSPLAVDDQAQARDIEVGDVGRSKQNVLLERQGMCRQIAGDDFFNFTQWLAQCAHAFRMGAARGKAVGDGCGADFGTGKRAGRAQPLRDGAHKGAVCLRLALADVLALKRQAVVGLRKGFACIRAAFGIAEPLHSHGFAAMTDNNAAGIKDAAHGTIVNAPMGCQPSEGVPLLDVSPMGGLRNIHAFDGFHSFFDFVCNTFFHCRYVVVRDKVTTKVANTTVYNLSIDVDESYIVPIGIAHNCRCTVVQVRRKKYPETEHDEAIRLGEAALGDDTKGIFRFNSGQQQKTMPDYNPYTIKRCKDCDVAQGKATLAFVAENELCAACRLVRQCYGKRTIKKFRERRKALRGSVKKVTKRYKNLETGTLYQSKKSFKNATAHAHSIEELEMHADIMQKVGRMVHVRRSPLGEGKNMTNAVDVANIKKKKDRGVSHYEVYHLKEGGTTWEIKTEVYKNRKETVYNIRRIG